MQTLNIALILIFGRKLKCDQSCTFLVLLNLKRMVLCQIGSQLFKCYLNITTNFINLQLVFLLDSCCISIRCSVLKQLLHDKSKLFVLMLFKFYFYGCLIHSCPKYPVYLFFHLERKWT